MNQNDNATQLLDITGGKPTEPTRDQLSRVALLANQLQEVDAQLAEHAERLKQLQAKRQRIAMEDLPGLMAEFGLSEFKLADGSKVTIRPFVKASLPTERAIEQCRDTEQRLAMRHRLQQGFAYLRKHGAGALIKHFLKADFGKDSDATAQAALKTLRKLGVKAELTKGVHPSTLSAWVKERLENGQNVDMQLFAVFAGDQAHIAGDFESE